MAAILAKGRWVKHNEAKQNQVHILWDGLV